MRRFLSSLLLTLCLVVPASASAATPFGVHSMVYENAPRSFKETMFREAEAAGATSVRFDVALANVFPTRERVNWAHADESVDVARSYGLEPSIVVTTPPNWVGRCDDGSYHPTCPADPTAYGDLVARLAAHLKGRATDFEIGNEPDAEWAYRGTAAQYAAQLAAAHDTTATRVPSARIHMGGLASTSPGWLRSAMMARPDFLTKTDSLNVHLRGGVAAVREAAVRWRRFATLNGAKLPLWVTEAGYPADPAYQADPAYTGGDVGQARYVADMLRELLSVGTERIYVTERDNLTGQFASEGLLGGEVLDPPRANPSIVRRPAFYTYRLVVNAWRRSVGIAVDPRLRLGVFEIRGLDHPLRVGHDRRLRLQLRCRAVTCDSNELRIDRRSRSGRAVLGHTAVGRNGPLSLGDRTMVRLAVSRQLYRAARNAGRRGLRARMTIGFDARPVRLRVR